MKQPTISELISASKCRTVTIWYVQDNEHRKLYSNERVEMLPDYILEINAINYLHSPVDNRLVICLGDSINDEAIIRP